MSEPICVKGLCLANNLPSLCKCPQCKADLRAALIAYIRSCEVQVTVDVPMPKNKRR